MNRHQSNPFLSDWADEDELQLAQARRDIAVAAGSSIFCDPNELESNEQATQQLNVTNGPPTTTDNNQRRSSCGQMSDHGGANNTAQVNRQALYRRNMSSFEAASCLQQYENEQQLKQNNLNGCGDGGGGQDNQQQKELIAKMTADFQLAMESSNKQFADDLANYNPFDPFETIVDDDSLPLASPAAGAVGSTTLDSIQPGEETSANETMLDAVVDNRSESNTSSARLHESIDDDDEELVSTPVRNIKSSPINNNGEQQADTELDEELEFQSGQNYCKGQTESSSNLDNNTNSRASNINGQDSIAKAALFASLMASAENATGSQDEDRSLSARHIDSPNEAATSHVIKGSPTAADGTSDRPVSFFDPFETVIDKDDLTSLVGDNQHAQQEQRNSIHSEHEHQTNSNELRTLANRVAESISIETVIENAPSVEIAGPYESHESNGDNSSATTNHEHPESLKQQQQQHRAPESESTVRQYDSSAALARPTVKTKLEQPHSGFMAPQSTPAKKFSSKQHVKSRVQRRGDAEPDSSSSSSEEDDRIKVIIRARQDLSASSAGSNSACTNNPISVPLLPPPPSRSSMKQARERGQVDDIPSPIMGYKSRLKPQIESDSESDSSSAVKSNQQAANNEKELENNKENDDEKSNDDQFVIQMRLSDNEDDAEYAKPETPLYDEDTSYVLEEYPQKHDGSGWDMMLRYPPKKKLTTNRFWKKIFVKLAQVPAVPDNGANKKAASALASGAASQEPALCWALQIFDHQEDKKPLQEIPIQATYTVSEISSQLFDQFGKIFTIKLQYIFYKERVGVRQGQLARFIHTGHIGSSTTSGGHGVDPISIGAIKRMGAPIEHSPQISQIIKLGCIDYEQIKTFKEALEDCLFRMPIHRDRAMTTYKTEEVQMAVRDETYVEINQIGTVTKQLARVRLFFLSFLNGTPLVEVGVNEINRQGREVVGRMDILPVITEEWIRLEDWELHSSVDKEEFEKVESRLIKLTPPDATFFELMRFRVRPPRNRELPLQISANMTVSRTKVTFNCDVMVPGSVSRKHGQIPCENIAICLHIPECWIYFFREEKHFRMGSKKSVNRRPGKVKGIERFLGGAGATAGNGLQDLGDNCSLIEVTSGQAKYEHHHQGVVWRAARWPKESQSAYVQNSMKIRLPLTAYDKMPDSFYEYLHVEYTMPATTVSHTTLRSISVNPCDDEPAEKYVKYAAKYEYKVKMRLAVNLGADGRAKQEKASQPEASPIVIMKQQTATGDATLKGQQIDAGADDDELEREEDEDEDEEDEDD